jgi:hypothetical protein
MHRPSIAAAFCVTMLLGFGLSAPPARAGYDVTLEQVGSDVVASGSGSIDTAGLVFVEVAEDEAQIRPFIALLITGPTGPTPDSYWVSEPITGPMSFGAGVGAFASSGSGDIVGISGTATLINLPMLCCQRATSPTVLCRTCQPMTTRPQPASARYPAPTHGHGGADRPPTASRSTSSPRLRCRNPRACCCSPEG